MLRDKLVCSIKDEKNSQKTAFWIAVNLWLHFKSWRFISDLQAPLLGIGEEKNGTKVTWWNVFKFTEVPKKKWPYHGEVVTIVEESIPSPKGLQIYKWKNTTIAVWQFTLKEYVELKKGCFCINQFNVHRTCVSEEVNSKSTDDKVAFYSLHSE